MRIDEIQILDRHRADVGDLTDLAASIATEGLMHPVVVTTEGRMIAGHRRVAACKSLGLTDIKVTVIDGLIDAARLLRMERDENTCRKDMTPSEKVSLGRALEELERPKAKAAQIEGAREGAAITNKAPSVPPNERRSFDTREAVAPAVGMSPANYSRAKSVVEATQDEDPEIRSIAREAVEEMDRTGSVVPAYEKVRAARKPCDRPPAPPKYGGNRRKHLQVLDALAASLSGLAIAADEIQELDSSVTNEEASRIRADLSKSIRSLNQINNLLKERSR